MSGQKRSPLQCAMKRTGVCPPHSNQNKQMYLYLHMPSHKCNARSSQAHLGKLLMPVWAREARLSYPLPSPAARHPLHPTRAVAPS